MFKTWLAAALCCSSVLAQGTPTDIFHKAPPHIDEALRARIAGFLQAHVDGKFRVADQFVAEDSKDAFFTMEKRKFLGFEIVKIDYTDDYTKATVLSTVEVNFRPSPRFPNQRVKAPYKMLWKSVEGEWFWYTVNTGEWETPWGKMKVPGEAPPKDDPADAVISQLRNMDGKAVLNQVKVSKTDIELRSYENSSDTVEITNGLQGPVSLRVEGSPVVGLEIKTDKTELKFGETAKVTFEFKPVTKQPISPAVAAIAVEPLGRRLKLNVNFAIPPEVQKQLNKSK
jgi:hypothetical protein